MLACVSLLLASMEIVISVLACAWSTSEALCGLVVFCADGLQITEFVCGMQ
jgi:hypothetical protein